MAMQPENAFEDEVRKELRELKEAITMSRQEARAIARSQKETTTRLSQSFSGPSNHMEGTDVHRGQLAASFQTLSASMAKYRNTVARMLEECERAIERNTSLEEELVIVERKIDELRQRVKESEAEKREMLTRVTVMGRRDLHDVQQDGHGGRAHPDELSSARDGHVSHNVVDVAIENAERRLVLTTVHKALSEWQVDNLFPGTSFITGHRLLASDVDRAGVETSYLSICNDFKLVAASHHSPQLFYKHLKSIFDSYVNPDNNPDVQPLVKGLGAEDFDVDAFLVDELCSPPVHQIISVVPSQRVDMTTIVSLETNRCITTEWPRLSDLTKEDHESTYARKYLRRDVINAYIFEKFLQRSRKELFNMFYCNTFWFAKASQQVNAYDMTSHSESASIGIKRLRNAIYPQLRDGDFKVHPKVPAWSFVPIHGRYLISLINIHAEFTLSRFWRGPE
ncbi:hypothetical protein R1flu_009775 [Riccia fluitans]|uniref:Uncharacterized protein n=1 Tax=Riccia fluitans TaxID=41844 RepID=A0ABD1Z374_9MARC